MQRRRGKITERRERREKGTWEEIGVWWKAKFKIVCGRVKKKELLTQGHVGKNRMASVEQIHRPLLFGT